MYDEFHYSMQSFGLYRKTSISQVEAWVTRTTPSCYKFGVAIFPASEFR